MCHVHCRWWEDAMFLRFGAKSRANRVRDGVLWLDITSRPCIIASYHGIKIIAS